MACSAPVLEPSAAVDAHIPPPPLP